MAQESHASVYQIVTDEILKKLEQGVIPWRMPWKTGIPCNYVTKRPYSGCNSMMLAITAEMLGYSSPYWLTFNQCNAEKATVRKGEKSTIITFWSPMKQTKKEIENKEKPHFMLRYYRVFNVEQCDGLKVENAPPRIEPIAACEQIRSRYTDSPSIAFGGDRAYYKPSDDRIQLPPKDSFDSAESFYAVMFHEMAHSTGHEKRLRREGVESCAPFGSEVYSKEELVAEFGSAFLCGIAGIAPAIVKNSASYIQNWMSALRQDSKLLISASSKAQRAADYILGNAKNESVPA